jgi:putative oxidoreductase
VIQSLRRLFSTFARGLPGIGLLLLRLVVGTALISRAFVRLNALDLFAIAVGVLLIIGLWTPILSVLAAIVGVWGASEQPGDPWANIMLAGIGIALALLGPGAWSVDGRLFGWKRIDVRNKQV